MKYGRGATWICFICGGFYDWMAGNNDFCKDCNQKRILPLMMRKVAEKREKGIPIKSWSKRGRKAYLSRLVNMAFTDPIKYEESLIRLEIKDGNKRRANQVRRKVAARKAEQV